MGEQDIYRDLTEIFHDVFMREDIALVPKLSAKDVEGWDSFKMIEIIVSVEERYGIKLRSKDLDKLENVGELVEAIERGLAARR